MAKNKKRTDEQVQLDRAEMVRLLRRGWTKKRIAEKMGMQPSQISYDWKKVLAELREARLDDAEDEVTSICEQYSLVKSEAWDAWDKSKERRTKQIDEVINTGAGDRVKTSEIVEDATPGNEFLKTIVACLQAEREMKGLNAPKKMDIQAEVINWDALAVQVTDDRRDLVEQKIQSLLESGKKVGPEFEVKPMILEHKQEMINDIIESVAVQPDPIPEELIKDSRGG